jgi:general secretion pathway protein G
MKGKRPCGNEERGFTLIEIIAVVVVIGILATILVPGVARHIRRAKEVAAKGMISRIKGAVEEFNMDNGRYPGSLNDLVVKPGDVKRWPKGGYLDGRRSVPSDPWGGKYYYKTPGSEGHDYVIGSHGRDGKPGGEDDIDCWQILEE